MQLQFESSLTRERRLRRFALIVCIAFACVAAVFIVKWRGHKPSARSLAHSQAKYISGRVTEIVDGDTLKLRDSHFGVLTLRLFGVDAPEQAQPFGTQAAAFTRAKVFGKEIRCLVRSRDRYGRLVVVVLHDRNRVLNEELLSGGFAWWFYQYAPAELKYGELEAQARSRKVGLWRERSTPPWAWRTRLGEGE